MRFEELDLPGAWLIESDPIADNRGSFVRTWDRDALAAHGLDATISQMSVAFNAVRGTLRGMHFQRDPGAEIKIIRCTRGRVHDVLVDLRPSSPTHLRWVAVTLDSEACTAVYAPEGIAHGYMTLVDGCEMSYMISRPYEPHLAAGVRWNDPAFGIEWPIEPVVMSERDASFPDHQG